MDDYLLARAGAGHYSKQKYRSLHQQRVVVSSSLCREGCGKGIGVQLGALRPGGVSCYDQLAL